jgi:hypothetical protein
MECIRTKLTDTSPFCYGTQCAIRPHPHADKHSERPKNRKEQLPLARHSGALPPRNVSQRYR